MMKRIVVSIVMSLLFFGLSCQDKELFRSVDVKTFEKAVADTSYIVLDVRTYEEYAEGHIPGTDFNIDVLKSDFKAEALERLPKGKPVALYCRSGNRSKNAASILAQSGFAVLELGNGFRGWAAAGKPVEKQ